MSSRATQENEPEDGLIQVLSEDFQRLADRSQDAIYRLDIESQTFTFFNRRFLERFSIQENGSKTLTVKGSLLHIHPDDRETFKQERARSLESGGMESENEYRLADPDGSIRWMHDKWIVIRDADGQPVAIEGFIRDNTRRKQAEEELERSRRNALIGSYIVQDGRFVYVNPEFCRILEYSQEELIGTRSLQYVHEDYVERVRNYTRAMLKEERSKPYEFCVVDRKGRVKWIMETVTPMYHEGRRAVLGHFMDITQARKAAEEQQEREKLQAILEMAGAVSHELNNPLQVVLVCIENLAPETLSDESSRKWLLLLNKNIKRIIQIMRKLQNITEYAVKDYVQGKKIIDIDAASKETDPS